LFSLHPKSNRKLEAVKSASTMRIHLACIWKVCSSDHLSDIIFAVLLKYSRKLFGEYFKRDTNYFLLKHTLLITSVGNTVLPLGNAKTLKKTHTH
jgi:hypothetical protein